jgi:hypothetical protein
MAAPTSRTCAPGCWTRLSQTRKFVMKSTKHESLYSINISLPFTSPYSNVLSPPLLRQSASHFLQCQPAPFNLLCGRWQRMPCAPSTVFDAREQLCVWDTGGGHHSGMIPEPPAGGAGAWNQPGSVKNDAIFVQKIIFQYFFAARPCSSSLAGDSGQQKSAAMHVPMPTGRNPAGPVFPRVAMSAPGSLPADWADHSAKGLAFSHC